MPENWLTQLEHHVSLGSTLVILGFVAKQHKVWIRMKERLDSLWSDHCKAKGERFVPLDNGKH